MEQKTQPEIVDEWAQILIDRLKKKMTKLKIGKSESLRNSIRTDFIRAVNGNIERLNLLYHYYGAFVDMGVGSGQNISEVKYSSRLKVIRTSKRLGDIVGYSKRKPKKWYSVTITAEVNTLADLMMQYYGDLSRNVLVNELPKKIIL